MTYLSLSTVSAFLHPPPSRAADEIPNDECNAFAFAVPRRGSALSTDPLQRQKARSSAQLGYNRGVAPDLPRTFAVRASSVRRDRQCPAPAELRTRAHEYDSSDPCCTDWA